MTTAAAMDPGFLGVRLFFVLSGFLITGILLDTRDALPVGLAGFLLLHWYASQTGEVRLLLAGQELAFALTCCWLIAGAYRGFGGPAARLIEAGPIVYLGRISYGIYAYHMLVPWILTRILRPFGSTLPPHGVARLLIAGAVTVAVAALSWRFLEAPINALKRREPYDSGDPRQ